MFPFFAYRMVASSLHCSRMKQAYVSSSPRANPLRVMSHDVGPDADVSPWRAILGGHAVSLFSSPCSCHRWHGALGLPRGLSKAPVSRTTHLSGQCGIAHDTLLFFAHSNFFRLPGQGILTKSRNLRDGDGIRLDVPACRCRLPQTINARSRFAPKRLSKRRPFFRRKPVTKHDQQSEMQLGANFVTKKPLV